MNRLKSTLAATVIALSAAATAPNAAWAQSQAIAGPSAVISVTLVSVQTVGYSGYLSTLAGEAAVGENTPSTLPVGAVILSVYALQGAGKASVVVLEHSATGAKYGIELSRRMIEDLGLAVGDAVEAVSLGFGHVLTSGSRIVGFVPQPGHEDMLYSQELQR